MLSFRSHLLQLIIKHSIAFLRVAMAPPSVHHYRVLTSAVQYCTTVYTVHCTVQYVLYYVPPLRLRYVTGHCIVYSTVYSTYVQYVYSTVRHTAKRFFLLLAQLTAAAREPSSNVSISSFYWKLNSFLTLTSNSIGEEELTLAFFIVF